VGPPGQQGEDPSLGGFPLSVEIDGPSAGETVHGPFDVTIQALNATVKMNLELWVNGRLVASTDSEAWTGRVDPAGLKIGPGSLLTVTARVSDYYGTVASSALGLEYAP
jgi:hypothetical protein